MVTPYLHGCIPSIQRYRENSASANVGDSAAVCAIGKIGLKTLGHHQYGGLLYGGPSSTKKTSENGMRWERHIQNGIFGKGIFGV